MRQEAELLEANQQFVGSASLLCATFPGAEVVELPGLVATWCNSAIPFLNTIFLTGPVKDEADLEMRAAALGDYLGGKEKPPLFIVCRQWIPEALWAAADAAFGRAGLTAAMTLTGMAADELLPVHGPVTSDLVWRRIEDRDSRNQLSDINAAAYALSAEPMREALAMPEIWTDQFRGYVGKLEGLAVVTAGVMALHGALHIMCVATLPGHQRRGYADAVMRHSLGEMSRATGLTRTTLHATDAGRPLYLRMGYHETATFTGYMRPHS